MSKTRKRSLALLVVLAMLATLFMVPGTASAAATYSAAAVMQVTAGTDQELGRLKIEIPVAELNNNDYVVLRLPSDFNFNLSGGPTDLALTRVGTTDTFDIGTGTSPTSVQIKVPTVKNACYNNTIGYGVASNVTVDLIANNELKIKIANAAAFAPNTSESTGYFYVLFNRVKVASGFSGSINVTIEGKAGSPFVAGSVTIAQCGTGITNITVDSVKTITTTTSAGVANIDKIRLKEDRPGAFANNQTIKFKLPSGYKWQNAAGGFPTAAANISIYDGKKSGNTNITPADYAISSEDNERTMVITSRVNSTTAAYLMLQNLQIAVSDETLAKIGDIEVTVSGSATSTPSSFVVAKYGEYSARVYAVGEPKEVVAGRTEQEIGKFAIEEGIAGSLIPNRTITATLVGGAKWTADSNNRVKNISLDAGLSKGSAGVVGVQWDIIGSTGDVARLTIGGTASTDAVTAVLKGAYINVSPNATGDIKLVFGGTAGVTGEIVVAKAVKPVTASIEGSPANIILGAQGQEIPPIIIAENKKEAIDATYDNRGTSDTSDDIVKNLLRLEFPMDVLPSMPSKVEVIEGDLVIDPNYTNRNVTADGRWYIEMKIKSTSSKPSKIKVSGVKLNVSRTVPEGALNVAVKGPAVVQTTGDFPGYTSAAVVKVAECITPAAEEQKATASFVIGSTTYKVNGVEKTMDVAPYIKDGRTFMPLRYVGLSLGVAEQNILWDDVAKTATLMKGDKVVQVKIGSTALIVNGVTINMDVAPEIKDGRTMMPLRFIAQAFGAKLTWDDATKTASFEL